MSDQRSMPQPRLVAAGMLDNFALVRDVILPTIAKGVLLRRPSMVRLAERLDIDRRAVRRLQRLRRTHGGGPVLANVLGRRLLILLLPEHVERVLAEAPEPFSPASYEKRAALAHFEPHVSLVSTGAQRTARRALNERALETEQPVHSLAQRFVELTSEEAETLTSPERTTLTWAEFTRCWHRAARGIALGDAAADDQELTDSLARLRSAGNWAFLHPGRDREYRRYRQRLAHHLARAEPGTLAAALTVAPGERGLAVPDQVTHWLFAFDAAAMAAYRALALLAAHPAAMQRARDEGRMAMLGKAATTRPFLRATFLESLRLWPTTPAILRETTGVTRWEGGLVPKGASVLIFAPFFHRDEETVADANRFAPELWLGDAPAGSLPFVPFSRGPAACPGRNVVLLTASTLLGTLLAAREPVLSDPARLRADRPLPGTLDPSTLQFEMVPGSSSSTTGEDPMAGRLRTGQA